MNIFIFGIDGAAPSLVSKWIDQGHLPSLQKIRNEGLSGKLESTFPPITGPAWTSFQTGVNPGKHGVFNWLDLSESYRGKTIDQSSIKARTIWDIISHKGGKVGILSLPLTYPPEAVNGFLVPGFLTPCDDKAPSYPQEINQSLYKNVPNFEFTPPFFSPLLTPRKWVKKLKSTTRARGAAARFLYKEHEPTTFMVHFFSTDHVQHKLWDYRDDEWDPRLEVFKETDRQIGKLMEIAPENSTFIAMSDHGFGPMRRVFNVNNWLHQIGYLKFNRSIRTLAKKKLSDFGLTEEALKPLGERLYPLAQRLNLIDNPAIDTLTDGKINTLFLSHRDVNWSETIAYSRSDIGHIRINLDNYEKQGISGKKSYKMLQKDLMSKLEDVKLPDSGRKLAEWIKPKEEVYHGPFTRNAPDILFNPLPRKTAAYGAVMFASSNVFDLDPSFDPGHHRRDGILFASGPTVSHCGKDASIYDIAPTILNLLTYPIPEQMDGKVIEEIAPRKPSYNRLSNFYKRQKQRTKRTNGNESREKLQNLGYL